MFLHIVFIALYLLSSIAFPGEVVSSILVVHALMVIRQYFAKKIWPDPMFFYALNMIIVSIANIAMIYKTKAGIVGVSYSYIVPDKIDSSCLIWAMGNAFIFIGFDVFRNKSFYSVELNITSEKNLRTLFWISFISLFRELVIKDATLGSIGQVFSIFSLVAILFFARLWGKYQDKRYRNYTLILFTVKTVFALLYAYLRGDILGPTVAMFFGYFLGLGDYKKLLTYRVIPFIVILYFANSFFSFFGTNRAVVGTGMARIQTLMAISKEDQYYGKNEDENLLDRMSILPQLTSVERLVAEKGGFYKGQATQPLLIALIPRIVWPDKPLISLGSWFAFQIGQGNESDTYTYSNSVNMTIPGHIFLDFGWIGMLIGCFFVGALLACLWGATDFYKSSYNITGITLGGYLLFCACQGIGADLQIVITLLSYYCIFLFIKRVL